MRFFFRVVFTLFLGLTLVSASKSNGNDLLTTTVINKKCDFNNTKDDLLQFSSFSFGTFNRNEETHSNSTKRLTNQHDTIVFQILPVQAGQEVNDGTTNSSHGVRQDNSTLRKTVWNCKGSPENLPVTMEIYQNESHKRTIWDYIEQHYLDFVLEVTYREGSLSIDFLSRKNETSSEKQSLSNLASDLDKKFCFRTSSDAHHMNQNTRIGDSNHLEKFNSATLTNKFRCVFHSSGYKKPRAIQDVYIGLLFTAATFLLVTVIVYIIIWDYHSLHGWTIFSEVVSNFFMILTVGLAHLYVRDQTMGAPSFGCLFLATSSHFFFLSTFCWMTVINFNLWRTFRNIRVQKRLVHYLCYATFAFGVPGAFVILGISMDTLLSRHSPGSNDSGAKEGKFITQIFPPPNYGQKFCYVAKEAQGMYIYYPIGSLIVTNVMLFTLTALSLYKHHQETKVLRTSQRLPRDRVQLSGNANGIAASHRASNEAHKKSIILFAKLFCVMGVSWISEVFAWAFSKSGENVPLYWIIFDVANLLQAIAVFIIFVCKRKVWTELKRKFCGQS